MSEPKSMGRKKLSKAQRAVGWIDTKPKSALVQVKQVKRQVAKIKKELKQDTEIKSFDGRLLGLTQMGWDFLGIYNLFAPPQSLAGMSAPSGGRVGDKVWMTGMDLRYKVNNTSTSILSLCRVVVLVDHDNALAGSGMFDTATILATTQAPYAFYLRQNRDRFRVLYDVTHTLDVTENAQYFERKNIKIDMPCVFVPGSTAITNNAIKIIFISDQLPATSTILANYAARIYYKDA